MSEIKPQPDPWAMRDGREPTAAQINESFWSDPGRAKARADEAARHKAEATRQPQGALAGLQAQREAGEALARQSAGTPPSAEAESAANEILRKSGQVVLPSQAEVAQLTTRLGKPPTPAQLLLAAQEGLNAVRGPVERVTDRAAALDATRRPAHYRAVKSLEAVFKAPR